MTTFFFPSFFDLLLFDACGFVWLCYLGFSRFVRKSENERIVDCELFEKFEQDLREWKTAPPEPLERLTDLALVGEVLPRRQLVADELGEWDPQEHRAEDPVLFDAMTWVFPVEQGYAWKPAWATPTGAWQAVAPRQLEVSPS